MLNLKVPPSLGVAPAGAAAVGAMVGAGADCAAGAVVGAGAACAGALVAAGAGAGAEVAAAGAPAGPHALKSVAPAPATPKVIRNPRRVQRRPAVPKVGDALAAWSCTGLPPSLFRASYQRRPHVKRGQRTFVPDRILPVRGIQSMAKHKVTVSLDRAKAETARALVSARSTSEAIDIALDRLIRAERIQRDVEIYKARPQTAQEI